MSIRCIVIPRRNATPSQLQALGAALHRWYRQETREHGMALYTNENAIRALLGGQLLLPDAPKGKAEHRGAIPLDVRGVPPGNRAPIIASLRQAIPAPLVEDVLIDGRSWKYGGKRPVRVLRLPSGSLLIPVETDGPEEGPGLVEISRTDPHYGTWLPLAEDGDDPRPRPED